MNYYKLTFSDGMSYKVEAKEESSSHFLKALRRFVSCYVFDDVTYLEQPVKFERTDDSGKVYKNWNTSRETAE